MGLEPQYLGMMTPRFACREMPTRHCPDVYGDLCGPDRPCARYESTDVDPWLHEQPGESYETARAKLAAACQGHPFGGGTIYRETCTECEGVPA